jgi:hypothetical protein
VSCIGGKWSSAWMAMALHYLKLPVKEWLSWRRKASGSELGRLCCHGCEEFERDGRSSPPADRVPPRCDGPGWKDMQWRI